MQNRFASFRTADLPADLDTYRTPTELTACGPALDAFYATIPLGAYVNTYHKTALAVKFLYQNFAFTPEKPFSGDTAEDAAVRKSGNSRDFAHVVLAVCRKAGIACRYVEGTVGNDPAEAAWIEVFENNFGGWTGLDPVRNIATDGNYRVLRAGHDAADCAAVEE